jgi:ABC-type glycerol-3-phosphate transport system permease component
MKKSLSDKAFSFSTYVILAVMTLITLYPLLLALSVSFSDDLLVQKYGYSLIPRNFSLDTYVYILRGNWIVRSYGVTILVTVLGTALSLLITSLLAYAISVKTVKYRNGIALFCYFTMVFSAGLVPWYILMTRYYKLVDSVWALVIPYLVNPFYMFLMRNYFQSIPESVSESAKIDGANELNIFTRIILPLSGPIIATVSLFIALSYWNDWWLNLLLVTDTKYYTLQYQLFQILSNALFFNSSASQGFAVNVKVPTETIKMATTMVTIGPIIFLYPFLQRYFIKGIMIGAVKG